MVFWVLYFPKISEKVAFHLPKGGQHAPTGAIPPSPPLAPPLLLTIRDVHVFRCIS